MTFKIVQSSPVLHSLTRVGLAKFWQGHVYQDCHRRAIGSSHWQTSKAGENTKVVFSVPYECHPKNVGRLNETSAETQASSEFASMVAKQGDKGYAPAGKSLVKNPLPMLAQKFSDRHQLLSWPVYVQPKYNGNRMLFDGTRGMTRGGKENIPEVIRHLRCDTGGLLLDGELMLPGNPLLQESMKAIKKYRPEVSPQLIYIVYDIVNADMNFSERYMQLSEWVSGPTCPPNIQLAPTFLVASASAVMKRHKTFTNAGFEGTMVRDNSDGYQVGQRSNQLQKLKDMTDDEFLIVDVVEGAGQYTGCAIFVCDNKHGGTFRASPEGTIDYKKDLFRKRRTLKGQWLTVRYQELSQDHNPIFPVGVDVREKGEF